MNLNHSEELVQSNESLDLFKNIQVTGTNRIIDSVADYKIDELKLNEMCFYKIKQLAFDEGYPGRTRWKKLLFKRK